MGIFPSLFKQRKRGPSEPSGQSHPPPKQVAQVARVLPPVEVIPNSLWVEQELALLRRAGQWPCITAQCAERLLGVGPGEVTELTHLQDAFDIVEELGSGECATVFRAVHRREGEQLALKVLQIGGAVKASVEATAMAMARNELLSLRALPRHEGVTRLLGVWCTPTQLAFGLELLDSGDLLVPIERSDGAISEAAARPLFAQLARGVRHMHAHGWAHRDIKPENICLCESAGGGASARGAREGEGVSASPLHQSASPPLHTLRVKLIDFGTAARCDPGENVLRGLCGTPAYVAPEVGVWIQPQLPPLTKASNPNPNPISIPEASLSPKPDPSLSPKPTPAPPQAGGALVVRDAPGPAPRATWPNPS